MDGEGFRNYCVNKGLKPEAIEASLRTVKRFDEFLKRQDISRNVAHALESKDIDEFLQKRHKDSVERFGEA